MKSLDSFFVGKVSLYDVYRFICNVEGNFKFMHIIFIEKFQMLRFFDLVYLLYSGPY